MCTPLVAVNRTAGEAVNRSSIVKKNGPVCSSCHRLARNTGTGLVHTAPGHGRDDYATGRAHGLDAYAPVDDDGKYTAELGDGAKALGLQGRFVFDANPFITAHLAATGHLLNRPGETITHKYPICWRTKTPLITRATTQWFIAMDEPMRGDPEGMTLRQRALAEIDRLHAKGAAAAKRGEATG